MGVGTVAEMVEAMAAVVEAAVVEVTTKAVAAAVAVVAAEAVTKKLAVAVMAATRKALAVTRTTAAAVVLSLNQIRSRSGGWSSCPPLWPPRFRRVRLGGGCRRAGNRQSGFCGGLR